MFISCIIDVYTSHYVYSHFLRIIFKMATDEHFSLHLIAQRFMVFHTFQTENTKIRQNLFEISAIG